MTRTGEEPATIPHYNYSATNSTLTGVAVDGMDVLITDALTLQLVMPDDFDQSTGFTFNFQLEGVSGVAAGFDVSNITVIMGDGQFGGKITGIDDSGANLVLVGQIAPSSAPQHSACSPSRVCSPVAATGAKSHPSPLAATQAYARGKR